MVEVSFGKHEGEWASEPEIQQENRTAEDRTAKQEMDWK